MSHFLRNIQTGVYVNSSQWPQLLRPWNQDTYSNETGQADVFQQNLHKLSNIVLLFCFEYHKKSIERGKNWIILKWISILQEPTRYYTNQSDLMEPKPILELHTI